MMYRIKEVKLDLSDETLIYFFPQIQRKHDERTTGYLWWKKTIPAQLLWHNLFKDKDGEVICSEPEENSDNEFLSRNRMKQ